jgi:hypothetical protein
MNPALFWIDLLMQLSVGGFILGLIVLAAIPVFGLTIRNLFVFILGAIVGSLILRSLLQPILVARGVFNNTTMAQRNQVAYVEFFFGALIGGTILVWLKMFLQKRSGKLDRPRNSSASR